MTAEVASMEEDPDPADPDASSSACVGAVLSGRVDARPGDWRRPPNPRPHGGRPPRRWDRGSTTAELAVALPALMVLLIVGVLAVKAVAVQLQCVAAAREGALSAARGGSGEAAAGRAAPKGASVSVSVTGDQAKATVSAPVPLLGATFTVEATSTAAVEPGAASTAAVEPGAASTGAVESGVVGVRSTAVVESGVVGVTSTGAVGTGQS